MTQYSVYDKTTGQSETFFKVSNAKKRMKALIAEGHEVQGSKTKIYSNGDWVSCGEISLTSNNKTFVANSRQKKPGY